MTDQRAIWSDIAVVWYAYAIVMVGGRRQFIILFYFCCCFVSANLKVNEGRSHLLTGRWLYLLRLHNYTETMQWVRGHCHDDVWVQFLGLLVGNSIAQFIRLFNCILRCNRPWPFKTQGTLWIWTGIILYFNVLLSGTTALHIGHSIERGKELIRGVFIKYLHLINDCSSAPRSECNTCIRSARDCQKLFLGGNADWLRWTLDSSFAHLSWLRVQTREEGLIKHVRNIEHYLRQLPFGLRNRRDICETCCSKVYVRMVTSKKDRRQKNLFIMNWFL